MPQCKTGHSSQLSCPECSTFQREDRYLVLKRRDIKNSLTDLEQHLLMCIAEKVHKYRTDIMEKEPLHCVVVEKDWPEYEPTWKAIEDRMSA